jgi:hypothetical protein
MAPPVGRALSENTFILYSSVGRPCHPWATSFSQAVRHYASTNDLSHDLPWCTSSALAGLGSRDRYITTLRVCIVHANSGDKIMSDQSSIRIAAVIGSVRPGNYTGKAMQLVIDELRTKRNVVVDVIDE